MKTISVVVLCLSLLIVHSLAKENPCGNILKYCPPDNTIQNASLPHEGCVCTACAQHSLSVYRHVQSMNDTSAPWLGVTCTPEASWHQLEVDAKFQTQVIALPLAGVIVLGGILTNLYFKRIDHEALMKMTASQRRLAGLGDK